VNSSEQKTCQVPIVIVTYRDVFQWVDCFKGNEGTACQEHGAWIKLSRRDIKSLGLAEGEKVRLSNQEGSIVVAIKSDPGCPPGFGYMPVSPLCNKLTGYNSGKGKLPNFKRIEAVMEKAAQEF